MVWIKSDQSLARHPKLKQACRLLGLDTPTMIGHLHLLWWWATEYAPDGNLSRWDIAIIAEEAGWRGDPTTFIGALIKVGFLDEDLSIHDWHEYSGNLKARRDEHAEAMRSWRARRDQSAGQQEVAVMLPAPKALSLPQPQPEPARKGKHKLPADYPITDAMWEWARSKGVVKAIKVEEEHERFCDYWHGNGKMMVDWLSTWRNWMRRSVEYATANQQRGGRWLAGQDQANRPRLITDYSPNVEGQHRLEEIAKRNLPSVGGS